MLILVFQHKFHDHDLLKGALSAYPMLLFTSGNVLKNQSGVTGLLTSLERKIMDSIHRIHKDGGRAEEVWGELSAAWSRGVLGMSSVSL